MTKQEKANQDKNRYFTETGVDITERITSGKTLFFEWRNEAAKYAEQKRTYVFEVFNRTEQIGFGVTT